MKPRIALVVSHPIQHFCPQYVSFAQNKDVEFKVFFASALGYKKYYDPNFKKEISWGNLNLDQFDHVFLNGEEVIASDKNLDAPTLDNGLAVFKPDVVIIYGYFQKLQRRAHRWAKANKVKLAYIADSELRQGRNRWKEAVKYWYIRDYFSAINYFLSVGNANEAFYKHYGVSDEKILRMHFPIDIKQYKLAYAQKNALREKIRTAYGIGEGDIVTAVVGKLTHWKNQDHLIDALKLLETEGVFVHLFILGSGDMMAEWQAKATILDKSKVHFTGFVNIEDLPAYYAASDFYVHPAAIEPHSIAVSEAIYMGCPIIISSSCGSHGETDDVQEGRNGLVFEFGSIPDLAAKIKYLIQNTAKRADFSQYSHQISTSFQDNSHFGVLDKLKNIISK